MLSGHPHIFTYILCNYNIYNLLSGSPPYVYLHMYIYIYRLSYRVTHTYTHIYIYFKPHNPSTQPSQQQQPAAAAAAAAGCCYTFEEMEEMQASANVPIRDIYQAYGYARFVVNIVIIYLSYIPD